MDINDYSWIVAPAPTEDENAVEALLAMFYEDNSVDILPNLPVPEFNDRPLEDFIDELVMVSPSEFQATYENVEHAAAPTEEIAPPPNPIPLVIGVRRHPVPNRRIPTPNQLANAATTRELVATWLWLTTFLPGGRNRRAAFPLFRISKRRLPDGSPYFNLEYARGNAKEVYYNGSNARSKLKAAFRMWIFVNRLFPQFGGMIEDVRAFNV